MGKIFFIILLRKSPYSVQIRENTDQKNSVFGHFSRNEKFLEPIEKNLTLFQLLVSRYQ